MIRVLIADDHLLMRLGLEVMIESAPDLIHCGSADDGVAAVSLALQAVPDVVVLDVGMLGGDGIEATRRIRNLLPDTGVVILTALPWSEDRAWAAGADAFVLKSASAETLIEHIRVVAQRRAKPGAQTRPVGAGRV